MQIEGWRSLGGMGREDIERLREVRRDGGYLSDMAIPILRSNTDFYCFLHETGGDDDRIDGPLCCTGRHG